MRRKAAQMDRHPTSYDDLPLTLSVRELMPILSVGRNTAYELIRSGQIRSVRIGRRILIPKAEVLQFLKNN